MYSVLVCAVNTVGFFFFSSRRRHTRCSRDWSSDVCSSDLIPDAQAELAEAWLPHQRSCQEPDRFLLGNSASRCRSEERRVGKSVDLGGRRIIKKKKEESQNAAPQNKQTKNGRDLLDSSTEQ